jgi:hypothetical protein
MYLPDYTLEELAFAFRCYVYSPWHTFYRQSITERKLLKPEALQAIHPELLMATSQDLMREHFEPLVVQAGIPRLCKPGSYVGSFVDITKEHVRN